MKFGLLANYILKMQLCSLCKTPVKRLRQLKETKRQHHHEFRLISSTGLSHVMSQDMQMSLVDQTTVKDVNETPSVPSSALSKKISNYLTELFGFAK